MKSIKKNEREQGQSMVEFLLVLPILMLILSGLLDLGRIYFTFIALEEAAAEAALYLAIRPECANDNGKEQCAAPNNALYRAESAGNDEFDMAIARWNIPWDDALALDGFSPPFVGGTDNATGNTAAINQCTAIGCTVVVQVKYRYEFLTPLVQEITRGIDIELQASQLIVFE